MPGASITQEQLDESLLKLEQRMNQKISRLGQRMDQKIDQKFSRMETVLVRWVVGLFFGSVVLMATIIGTYTTLLLARF